MEIEVFNPETDRDACHRIWEEVGWLDRSDESQVKGMDALVDAGRARVVKLDGEPECLVLAATGSIRYLNEDLPFSGISGVTTSRVARRQGIAARLTAHVIAEEAEAGAAVSGLGMFEQGFYDRLGYGTGTYDRRIAFDPQTLTVPFPSRSPKRLTLDDYDAIHRCRQSRRREHGYVTFDARGMTEVERMGTKKTFGLGYYDGPDGALSHHVWILVHDAQNGPYNVLWMAYQTPEQFLELMGVIRTLSDQVHLVYMSEPPGIQLQDFVMQPIRNRSVTYKTKFESGTRALAWWQIRMCDVQACLSRTHLRCDDLRFNLKLSDPIDKYLDGATEWKGVAGDYVVTLGKDSGAEGGRDASLPTLTTTVNAFSRLWLGVRPATGLAVTDALEADAELLDKLDWALRLPEPVIDWDF